jgi:glutathione S-transferase
MIELYNSPVSTCSQKVRMALLEKNVPWTDRVILFAKNDHLSDWYLALNPNGVVPTLVHDNRVIIDSSVINEYLDDVFPETPLRPDEPYELAHMRAWRQYIDEVPTTAIRYPSFNAFLVPMWSSMTEEQFRTFAEKMPLRKHFYLKMGRNGFAKNEVDAAIGLLRQTVERMEQSLSQTEWLANDMFTLADISIIPTIVRMEDLGLAHLWADSPRVGDWYRRLQRRRAFALTYYPGTRTLEASC